MAANSRANSSGWSLGEKLTYTQANTLDTNGAQSVNRNSTESGWRRVPIAPMSESYGATPHIYKCGVNGIVSMLNADVEMFVPLHGLPQGHVLNNIRVKLVPQSGHGALPTTLPIVSLILDDALGPATVVKSVACTSANVGTYQLGFTLTPAATPTVTIDNSAHVLLVGIKPEHGTNSIYGLVVMSIEAYCTVDPSYAGPDFSFWL